MSTANSRYNALVGSSSAPAATGGPLSMANLPTVQPQTYGSGTTPVSVPTYSIGPITDSSGAQTPSTPATGTGGGTSSGGGGGSGGGQGGGSSQLPGPTAPLSPDLAEAMLRNTAARVRASGSNVGPNPVSTLAAMEAIMMRDNAIPNYTPMFGNSPVTAPVKPRGFPNGGGSIYSTGKNSFAEGGMVEDQNPLQTATAQPPTGGPTPPPPPNGYHGMRNTPRPPGDDEGHGRRDWGGDHSWRPRWGGSWNGGHFNQLQREWVTP